jgi:dienelactone hydrolase
VIVTTTVVVIAIAAAGAMLMRSVFSLPRPTGPFPIGTVALKLDRTIDPGETTPGLFIVQMWFPALPCADRAPYGTGVKETKRQLYKRFIRTHSARNASPAARRSPLIVYVPGWRGQRTDNTALAEELASHGYIVAALDDVMRDSPVLDPMCGVVDLQSERAYRATLELWRRRLAYESRRVSAVLDHLAKLDADDPDERFTERLDLRHVGILGYSFGGAVALETCRRDKRFLGAMNLDGLLCGAGTGYSGGVPYFLVSNAMPDPTPDELASDDPAIRYTSDLVATDLIDQHQVLRYGGYKLQVAHTTHLSFTDIPLYAPLQRLRAGWPNPPRITAALRAYALAFFAEALHGTPSPLLRPGTRGRPAMTLAVGSMVTSR